MFSKLSVVVARMKQSRKLYCDFKTASLSRGIGPVPSSISASIGLEMGALLFGCVGGTQKNVTGQIAAKFALDSFCSSALNDQSNDSEIIVQQALREANRRVYEYSSKMLSASRVTNTGLFSIFDGLNLTAARTGDEDGYLWRGGEITQLFSRDGELGRAQRLERFIGANKQLLADISTLEVRPGDVVWLTNFAISQLRIFNNIPFEQLTAEGIALEVIARLKTIVSFNRQEEQLCSVFVFENPPIILRDLVQ